MLSSLPPRPTRPGPPPPDLAAMRGALVLCLLALLGYSLSSDVYCSSPNVFISSPFLQTTLNLTTSCIVFNWTAGTFTLNGTTKYTKGEGGTTVSLPPVTISGNVYILSNQGIAFSYPAENSTYCSQSSYSAPSLCPFFQRISTGPWLVAYPYSPTVTTSFTITYTAPTKNTNGWEYSFLGAEAPFTYTCIGTCSPISSQVPPAPIPSNDSFTVRRSVHP